MQKIIQLFVLLLLTAQLAAQERQIRILNPDGTPATDAKAIAIKTIGTAMPMVDANLELLPINLRGKQSDVNSMATLENDNGTVSVPADAKGIVASNDNGFVFLPADAKGETAQLRSWAKVKIDTTSIPVSIAIDKLWLRISWSNNFCGMYPGNGILEGLGFPTAKKDPSPDWRFDPFVSWRLDVKVTENTDTFRVPPGEILVMLTDVDPKHAQSILTVHCSEYGKTRSNETTEIVFPKFGSIRGTLAVQESGLPDWGQQSKTRVQVLPTSIAPAHTEVHRRFGNIQSPYAININGAPRVEPTAQNWNEYAEFLSTDAGSEFRRLGFGSTAVEVETDGSFLFPLIPVGEYTLTRLTPVASPPESISSTAEVSKSTGLAFSVEAIFKSGDEQRTPMKIIVKENELNELGKLDAAAITHSQTVTYSSLPEAKPRPGTIVNVAQNVVRDGKTFSIKVANVVTEDGSLRVATPDDFAKAAAAGIPIKDPNVRIVKPGEAIGSGPDTFLQPHDTNAVPGILPPSAEIAYEQRTQIVDGKEVVVTVPRIVQRRTTDPIYFGPEDELNKRAVDPAPRDAPGFVAPFEPDVPSTPDPKPDAATLLIQNWLRSAKDPSDQTELRKLLQDHLQQEFEANQKSSQAEIERLQQLLVKSKEWLDQRQQRRDEIIKKRIDELLQQQALPKAEASGGR